MPRKSTEDKELVTGAKSRALISSFLVRHPGEHSVAAVAEKTKLSRGSAGQYLKHMADEGLIPPARKEGTSKFYRGAEVSNTAGELVPVQERTTSLKRHYTKRKHLEQAAAGEIEFVTTAPMLIKMGRNPQTGAIRVTFGEPTS